MSSNSLGNYCPCSLFTCISQPTCQFILLFCIMWSFRRSLTPWPKKSCLAAWKTTASNCSSSIANGWKWGQQQFSRKTIAFQSLTPWRSLTWLCLKFHSIGNPCWASLLCKHLAFSPPSFFYFRLPGFSSLFVGKSRRRLWLNFQEISFLLSCEKIKPFPVFLLFDFS